MRDFSRGFRPVIEHSNSHRAFLSTNPVQHMYQTHVPMIIGLTSNEAGAFGPEGTILGLKNRLKLLKHLAFTYSFVGGDLLPILFQFTHYKI